MGHIQPFAMLSQRDKGRYRQDLERAVARQMDVHIHSRLQENILKSVDCFTLALSETASAFLRENPHPVMWSVCSGRISSI